MNFKKKMSNFNSQYKNPSQNLVTTAYWCREQNFRKYFEMRKKNGIEPSINHKNFKYKNRCESYYKSKLEARFLLNEVENIKETTI